MNATPDHTARAHSEHGASVCKRFWNCPGSVQLSRGLPNASSAHAAEGTAAHELAELCLRSGQDAAEYVDRTVDGFVVDVDMADAVQVYLDHCRAVPGERQIEVRFDLSPLAPPAPMFGTADFMAYSAGHLDITDYKHGRGVRVDAEGNPQLRYYALGAMLALGPDKPVRSITATIVQPRAGGIRSTEIDPLDLVEWSIELFARVSATLEPDAPTIAGEWCRFCPAAGQCPAQATAALESAGMDFAQVVSSDDTLPVVVAGPPEIRLLSADEMARLLARADEAEQFIADLRRAAADQLQRGVDVPGWKLVGTQGRDAWRDAETAAEHLALEGLMPAELFEPAKLRSPAQIRGELVKQLQAEAKQAGERLTKKAAEVQARATLATLTHTPSSGVALVPTADPRPALPAVGTEFDHLPAPTESET